MSQCARAREYSLVFKDGLERVLAGLEQCLPTLSAQLEGIDLQQTAELSEYKYNDFIFMLKKKSSRTATQSPSQTGLADKAPVAKNPIDLLEADDESEA